MSQKGPNSRIPVSIRMVMSIYPDEWHCGWPDQLSYGEFLGYKPYLRGKQGEEFTSLIAPWITPDFWLMKYLKTKRGMLQGATPVNFKMSSNLEHFLSYMVTDVGKFSFMLSSRKMQIYVFLKQGEVSLFTGYCFCFFIDCFSVTHKCVYAFMACTVQTKKRKIENF